MVTDHIAQRWGLGQHEHHHREVVGHHTASTMFVNKHLSLDNILQWFFSPIICNHLPTFSRGEPNIVNKQLSLDGNLPWLYQLVVSQKPDIINYKANIFDNLSLLPKNHLGKGAKKKLKKKLTNVSFMYVCVAGNGEMLVFFLLVFSPNNSLIDNSLSE